MNPTIIDLNRNLEKIELQLKSIDIQLLKILQLLEDQYVKDEKHDETHASQAEQSIPEMISIREASKRTGLSYDHLRKECLKGHVKHIRIGTGKFLINFGALVQQLDMTHGHLDIGQEKQEFLPGCGCPDLPEPHDVRIL